MRDKPTFGAPCNHCGYCCMTEVCAIGKELTGRHTAPCKLLIKEGDKYLCKLALNNTLHNELGIGTGCCAVSQDEIINSLRYI